MPGPSSLEPDTAVAEGRVLDDVRTMIAEVIGEDYITETEIELDTAFYADLEIESIEFVALGEALQQRYGDRIDFPAWIATMEVDDIIAMTVGGLVDHIVTSLRRTDLGEPDDPGGVDHG